MSGDVFDRIRGACAAVAERGRSVHIDHDRLREYGDEYAVEPADQRVSPVHEHIGDDEATAALIVTLDAVNFGSGWHPVLRKPPGMSGSVTIASALRERAARDGPLAAGDLVGLTPDDCAVLFDQDVNGPAADLMALFARALNDLGRIVRDEHGGSFLALVAAAGQSAAALVGILDRMPLYHDVWRYDDIEVPIFKRAQITAHDLAIAFDGHGAGRFDDVDRLTIFADNLVPHVLRVDGVLRFDDDLVQRIDAEELLDPGAPEEVEIRAVALHAVELLAAVVDDSPREIDEILWRRGGAPKYKAVPRPRCRTTSY